MIVILHGVPGRADEKVSYAVAEPLETIMIRGTSFPSFDVARAFSILPSYADGPVGLDPIEHMTEYRMSYYDGVTYHYDLSKIDGLDISDL